MREQIVQMETYRIVPRKRDYVVEAVSEDGSITVVKLWPTEDLAVSHLRQLEDAAQRAHAAHLGGQDWRG